MFGSISPVSIKTTKRMQHWPLQRGKSAMMWGLLLICVTVTYTISRAGPPAIIEQKPSLLWRIRIVMTCLQIILRDGYHAIADLNSSNWDIEPTQSLMQFLSNICDLQCISFVFRELIFKKIENTQWNNTLSIVIHRTTFFYQV